MEVGKEYKIPVIDLGQKTAEKYNKKKWRYVQKQLKKSKKILYSNAATQKSINSAKSDLKKSINKLRRK